MTLDETLRGKASKERTPESEADESEHQTLKYQLLGPSLTKAGQDAVDQAKVSEIIYNASKGSKFFSHEESRDKVLTEKIAQIVAKRRHLETLDLTRELRQADTLIAQLELSRDLGQVIVHIDCDAFYAAVEQLDRPELADMPFAVGGGVLTTCNYAARRHGIRSGMASFVARQLCPNLVVLPLNHAKYSAKAAEVRAVLSRYDPRFESASIDEAYLNLTAYCAEHGLRPAAAVAQLRAEVHAASRVTVSAGIAANARLAKICSNINKPNGQFELPRERAAIMAFMRDLPCRKVNGVGRVLERELATVGVKTCGDIYQHRQYLSQLFGEKVYEFLLLCHLGLGRTTTHPAEEYERKSVGTEGTFRDMSDPEQLRDKLRSTAGELEADMRRAECKGRTLVLKVKLHTYQVYTRQVVPPKAVYLAADLYHYALPMLAKLEQEIPGMKLRLMGLRCTNLVSTKRPDTLAFFGLKPRLADSADASDHRDLSRAGEPARYADGDGQWERWPEETSHGDGAPAQPQLRADAPATADPGVPAATTPASPDAKAEGEEDERWECPVCSRPQPADARQLNEHIDLCLSRQAIRDTVQQHATEEGGAAARRQRSVEKRRGRPPAGVDPRQKRLCFG